MQAKLTLRIEEELINTAKVYSERSGKSVSRIVADLFKSIQNNNSNNDITQNVSSLKGVIKNDTSVSDYKIHLESKYL
ncbi:MAG: antitoxin [Proteobacteria bacterium]|nr:antitoxin [Pseudomonadota bacterium]MCH9711918.1 antitoxin [Pseudomonadota bacterium]MCH9750262.1 antitoxin [Pseudomonadota bacterium]